MPLSDTAVRQAKPKDKRYTLADTDGLFLQVAPNGTKSWHFRYRLGSKQPRFSFGTYPALSLKDARAMRDSARSLVAKGLDPRNATTEPETSEPSFGEVAEEWYTFKLGRWSPLDDSRKGSAAQARRVLDNDILPALKDLGITQVTRRQLVDVVAKIEKRGALNIAEKARNWIQQIFRFAVANGYIETNPSSEIEQLAAVAPPVQHNPILARDSIELQTLLKRLREYRGSPITVTAIRLMLWTMVRTIEVRRSKPGDFQLSEGLWVIPASHVKQLKKKVLVGGETVPDYIVPLPTQAIQPLKELLTFTREYKYAFAGRNDPNKMMSENTVNAAVKRMGFEGILTGHGLRGTISTALNQMRKEHGWHEDWIEAQLSHSDPNQSRKSYNHASYVEERRGMMQVWADYLDDLEKRELGGECNANAQSACVPAIEYA